MLFWARRGKIFRECNFIEWGFMDPKRIEAMFSWHKPKTTKAIWVLLGLIGYYGKLF